MFGTMLSLVTFLCTASGGEGETPVNDGEKQGMRMVVEKYASYYTALWMESRYETDGFTKLFTGDTVRLINDFGYLKPVYTSTGDYYDDASATLLNRRIVTDCQITMTRPRDYQYKKSGDDYFVFLYKSIAYTYAGSRRTFASWERLRLRWITGRGFCIAGIAKVSGPGEMPAITAGGLNIRDRQTIRDSSARSDATSPNIRAGGAGTRPGSYDRGQTTAPQPYANNNQTAYREPDRPTGTGYTPAPYNSQPTSRPTTVYVIRRPVYVRRVVYPTYPVRYYYPVWPAWTGIFSRGGYGRGFLAPSPSRP